jgi:hypothetical protein
VLSYLKQGISTVISGRFSERSFSCICKRLKRGKGLSEGLVVWRPVASMPKSVKPTERRRKASKKG